MDKRGELQHAYPLQDNIGQQVPAVTLQDTWTCWAHQKLATLTGNMSDMVESFNFALAEADSMDFFTVNGCVAAAAAAAGQCTQLIACDQLHCMIGMYRLIQGTG